MGYDEEIIHVIEGRTFDEIKEKLYQKYGSDYRIVKKGTEFRKAGLFGLKQKEVQVVKYKIDHKTFETDQNSNISYPSVFAEGYNPKPVNEDDSFEKNRKALLETLAKQSFNSNNDSTLKKFADTLNEISDKMDSLQNSISSSVDNHPTITKIEELLVENEFTHSYIKMIIDKIKKNFPLEQLEDFKLIERHVIEWIGESISIAKTTAYRPPHVIIIVGPTGVGKTTTIAKMAANVLLNAKDNNLIRPELCIVTIDTMRVGAMEQLEKFGEVLNKNVLKAESMNDVKQIYDEYKDHVDYIFIDTSGYSPNDTTHISEMKNMIDINMKPDIYLSISASTKASDIANIFRNYEQFDYDSVIVTKCDETRCFGNVISVLWEKHKSISYITDGQKVPKNMKKADIIDILLRLNGFNIDRIHIENVFGE